MLTAWVAAAQSSGKPPVWIPTFTEEFNQKELEFPKWSLHDPWGGHARNRESQAWVPSGLATPLRDRIRLASAGHHSVHPDRARLFQGRMGWIGHRHGSRTSADVRLHDEQDGT